MLARKCVKCGYVYSDGDKCICKNNTYTIVNGHFEAEIGNNKTCGHYHHRRRYAEKCLPPNNSSLIVRFIEE